MKCGQVAMFRFTWPGRDESFICDKHSDKLIAISGAMGLYLQLIPVFDNDKTCQQEIAEDTPANV